MTEHAKAVPTIGSMICGVHDTVPTIDERLALARRHVEAGRLTIVYQRQMVERLKAVGRDTKAAEELLAVFEHTQKVFERDLADLEKRRGAR